MAQRSDSKQIDGVLGVVLAGGKSSRMGTDKAHLVFRGQSLIALQHEKLADVVGIKNVFVSGNYPAYQNIVDELAGVGPLGGVSAVVSKLGSANYFLFLPVDMPKVTSRLLSRLVEEAEADSINNCWSYRDYEMPLLLRNHTSLSVSIAEVLAQPRSLRSVRRLCEALKYRAVDVSEAGAEAFANTNTSEQWKAVIDECAHECK